MSRQIDLGAGQLADSPADSEDTPPVQMAAAFLLFVIALTGLACAPAVVIAVWRWAL